MYKDFTSINDLVGWAKADKNVSGASAATSNRYPIRFVLFDNFRDSFEFISLMQSQFGCVVISVNDWMDTDMSDIMITYSQLAENIAFHINQKSDIDCVITPFSELARFYDNRDKAEFDTLISTIKSIESTSQSLTHQQRIYIPIVGLEGKMSKFYEDSQIMVWYFKNVDKQLNYKLIITNGTTYEVRGLETHFSLVSNMQQWMRMWRNKDAKETIISTSPALFANSDYANPDNAFSFCICQNVHDFLVKGLSLDFGAIEYKESDDKYWLQLAKEIDINHFSFEKFFNQFFHIDDLSNYNVFLKMWFECTDEFEKWLLTHYYTQRFCQKGYICQAIKAMKGYSDCDFFASIALTIFDLDDCEVYLIERAICLQQAARHQIRLTSETQDTLIRRIKQLSGQKGVTTALRYLSSLTEAEKLQSIIWLGKGEITKEDCKTFFPDLYYYLNNSFDVTKTWIRDYIDAYKQCKISNTYSDVIINILSQKNASEVAFNQWYQDFKTTKTILNSHQDIEIYYWIDGLGIEWIPFISELLQNQENIYLNETYIARALYPTTTENNKPALFDLSPNKLNKIGDLDSHAHKQGNKYPDYIIEEMDIVRNAIKEIINEYGGKKIAIVSDHGLTALSQLREGLNMVGVTSNHNGRLAIRTGDKMVSSDNYIVADDCKTMCALSHKSLCGKVPAGQSAHGGCTPEEILVPIFIISSQKNAEPYSAILLTTEISGTEPFVKYTINGLTENNVPHIIYNGKRYELYKGNDNIYSSNRLLLVEGENSITLKIGSFSQTSQVTINLGAKEDDLFDF